MELISNSPNKLVISDTEVVKPSNANFIEANTHNVSFSHLKQDCTIPVFSKDNECTIPHQDFIDATRDCAESIFKGNQILMPEIRVSHIVKGRIPSAIGKPVKELQDNEKTIYYERMMFALEIPDISETISGSKLSLTLGGVRAYNQENLYGKKSLEKFKFFIGFKNQVCTNLCVSSDGFAGDLRVGGIGDLKKALVDVVESYALQNHLTQMLKYSTQSLSEKQFAQFLGRCRLYNYLPKNEKESLIPMLLNDGQINAVARDYYQDNSFCRGENGDINLWNAYNLLTGANKSSYIDSFLNRSVNAQEVVQELSNSLLNKTPTWFLN
ncbi:MAG: hypothetical protein CML02_15540 [Pseudooceanicola sp.]|nr:hypothetical protein [Pseudooceanicola sp.]|tara:strand:+ start:3626 stop:4603 length:978 start_codon:yes stop_codon:yes gene_type:complete